MGLFHFGINAVMMVARKTSTWLLLPLYRRLMSLRADAYREMTYQRAMFMMELLLCSFNAIEAEMPDLIAAIDKQGPHTQGEILLYHLRVTIPLALGFYDLVCKISSLETTIDYILEVWSHIFFGSWRKLLSCRAPKACGIPATAPDRRPRSLRFFRSVSGGFGRCLR
jgi:hypothetical protein